MEKLSQILSIEHWPDILGVLVVLFFALVLLRFLKKYVGPLWNVARFFVWSCVILVLVNNLGFDVSSLLAGLGLGGVALALAAQDMLSNAFGSLTIFLDKPFKLGDHIKVDTHEGEVLAIGLRSTRLRTKAKTLITIPNKILASVPVENFSRLK